MKNNKFSEDQNKLKAFEYEQKGDYKQASAVLKRILKATPGLSGIHRDLGRIYLKQNKLEFAADELIKAIKLNPDCAETYMQMGIIYFRQKNFSAALEQFDKVFTVGFAGAEEQNLSRLHLLRGRCYRDMGNFGQAEFELNKALVLSPDDGSIIAEKARLNESRGDYHSALADFKRALKEDCENPDLYGDIGRLYTTLNMLSEAEKFLKKAISLNRKYPDYHIQLARVYEKKNLLEEARKELSATLNIKKNIPEYYSISSEILKKQGLYREASAELVKAVRLEPGQAKYYGDLGKIYHCRGKNFQALEAFKKASEKNSLAGEHNYEAAKILKAECRYSQALAEYRAAVKKNYISSSIYLDMAVLYRNSGQLKDAEKNFLLARDISPYKNEKWFQNRILNDIEICRRKNRLESFPRNLGICLTNRCNINCVMCEVYKHPWDIGPERVEEMKSIFPYVEQLLWQGGEVFLSPFFKELFIEACKYPNIRQTILTNGLLITKEWAEIFVRSNVEITFSIDSFNKFLYEEIRVGARFEQFLTNIELIKSIRNSESGRKINMNIQMLVMENNYSELKNVIEFAHKHGVKKVFLIPLDDSINRPDSFYLSPGARKEIGLLLNGVFTAAKKYQIEVVNSLPLSGWKEPQCETDLPESGLRDKKEFSSARADSKMITCLWPWQQLSICAGGNAVVNGLCPFFIVGDINKNSIKEIWNSKKIVTLRKQLMGSNENNTICTKNCMSADIPYSMLSLD